MNAQVKRALLAGACLAWGPLSTALPAQAQTQPQDQTQAASAASSVGDVRPLMLMLDKAALRDDEKVLIDTLVLAIETQPENASILVNYAISKMPAKEKAILQAVKNNADAATLAAVRLKGGKTPAARLDQIAKREAEIPVPSFFDPSSWDGQVSAGGSVLTGNTEEQAVTLGLKLDRVAGDWEHHLDVTGDYSRNAGVTTKRRLIANLDNKYFFSERGFAFALLGYELYKFSEFNWRLSEAAGLGYRLFQTDDMSWDLQGGPGARQTKLDFDGVENEFIFVLSSNYKWHLNDHLDLTNVSSAFFGSERSTLTNDAGLTVALTDHWSGRASFFVKHDTSVPFDQKPTETATRLSIVYDF